MTPSAKTGFYCLVAAVLLFLYAQFGTFTPPVPPEPVPTPGPLTIAVVCESANRSTLPVGQLAILNSLAFRETLKTKGHTFAVLDPNDVGKDGKPPPEWAWALDIAKPLPALCVRNKDGKAKRLDLPADPEAALVTLGKEGG